MGLKKWIACIAPWNYNRRTFKSQHMLKPYFPCALSPDNMMASAPSRTAMAMSETSALVGVGWLIMLSNIFVATMTGFSMLLHVWIISAWKKSKNHNLYHAAAWIHFHTQFFPRYRNNDRLVLLKLYMQYNLTCSKGTSSIGSSAPRSPRATIAWKDLKKFSM